MARIPQKQAGKPFILASNHRKQLKVISTSYGRKW